MRQSVRDCWLGFTGPLEGAAISYFYADILGLVTINYGNLVDPISLALSLDMVHPDGRHATQNEIADAWRAVKNDPNCTKNGHRYAKQLTSIRLTPEGIERLVFGKLESNDAALMKRIPNFQDLPACSILAMHSWAWACGAGAKFPALLDAVKASDFESAAIHIHINEWSKLPNGNKIHNAGLVPRNVLNKRLMMNAAKVVQFGLDIDTLEWEKELDAPLPADPTKTLDVCEAEYLSSDDPETDKG